MNNLAAERDAAAAREGTAIENLQAAEVTRDAILRDATTAKRGANRMEVAPMNLCTEPIVSNLEILTFVPVVSQ